jgi:uncharacterized repeat protein (TIGR01451 family)
MIADNSCPVGLVANIVVTEHFMINDLNVWLNVSHPMRNELQVYLVSPFSASVLLLQNNAGPNQNLDVMLDQASPIPPGDGLDHNPSPPYFDAIWRPAPGNLDAYNFQDAYGNWELHICDSVANAAEGTLWQWGLWLEGQLPAGPLGPSYIVAPAKVEFGQPIAYTIVVTNTSFQAVTNTLVIDPLPANTSFISGSLTCPGLTCNFSGNMVTAFGDIPPRGMSAITFAVQPLLPGGYTNTVVIDAPALTTTVDLHTVAYVAPRIYALWNFEADDGGFVASPGPDSWQWRGAFGAPPPFHSGPTVWATAADGAYDPGMQYALSRVVDLSGIPAENGLALEWWEWTDIDPNNDFGQVLVNGVEKFVTTGVLPDWTHRVVDITEFAGQPSVTLEWILSAAPTSTSGGGWYIDEVSLHSTQFDIDMAVGINDIPDPVVISQTLEYFIIAQNLSPFTETGFTVVDHLPATVDVLSYPGSCFHDIAERTITCSPGSLPGLSAYSIAIQVRPRQPGQIFNYATLFTGDPDPNPVNNAATVETTVLAEPPLDPIVGGLDTNSMVAGAPLTITITGNGFQDGARVWLEQQGMLVHELVSVTVDSPQQITARVPGNVSPGTYALMVVNPDSHSGILLAAFTVLTDAPPEVTGIDPAWGLIDTPVVVNIYGNNFAPTGMGVYISQGGGDIWLEGVSFVDITHLRAAAPISIPVGTYTLTVVNSSDGQTDFLPNAYNALDPATTDDLFVSGPIALWSAPPSLQAGQPTAIGLNIRRLGGQADLTNVAVDFYAGGDYLGRGTSPVIPTGGVATAVITWTTPLTVGQYTLTAVIDPDNTVLESDEANNFASRAVRVRPFDAADLPPQVLGFTIDDGALFTGQPQVSLDTLVSTDTVYLLFIEYQFFQSANDWVAAASTGWLPAGSVMTGYPWALQPGAGAHYLQVWAADAAGNVSVAPGLAYINVLPDIVHVAQWEANIFRFELAAGQRMLARLASLFGDADLYIWAPDGSEIFISETGEPVEQYEVLGLVDGVYQVEVEGHTSADYQLTLTPIGARSKAGDRAPESPDQRGRKQPYSLLPPDGNVGLPDAPWAVIWLYLPMVLR